MALTRSKWSEGSYMSRVPGESGVVVTEVFTHTTTAEIASGDIIEMGALPAGAIVTDLIVVVDALDSGADAITFDVGIMSGTFGDDDGSRTCGNEFVDGATTAQAGGVLRMTAKTGFEVAVDYVNDRGIGFEVDTAANTWANGTIKLYVSYIQN